MIRFLVGVLDMDFDLHTGYGPERQMSIFSAVTEKMSQVEAEKAFGYAPVLTPESEGFYVTKGDNTEFINELQQKEYPHKEVYSTTFEFGTLGDGTIASLQSLRNTIDENRLHSHGSTSSMTKEKVENRYMEMFYPSDEEWREKAVKDFKSGSRGVLRNKGLLPVE